MTATHASTTLSSSIAGTIDEEVSCVKPICHTSTTLDMRSVMYGEICIWCWRAHLMQICIRSQTSDARCMYTIMVDIHLASDVCDLMQICMRCARQHQMQISPYITHLMSSVVAVWQIGLTQETSLSIVPALMITHWYKEVYVKPPWADLWCQAVIRCRPRMTSAAKAHARLTWDHATYASDARCMCTINHHYSMNHHYSSLTFFIVTK